MDSRATRVSAEARVLLSPALTLRALAQDRTGGWWVLVRRPLLLTFIFGCVVSVWASGRLSARLITDGAMSFLFIPLIQIGALAFVYRRRPRPVPFAQSVDVFFTANGPWLVWLIAFAFVRVALTPVQATAPPPVMLWSLELSLVVIAAWSICIDLRFFREVLPRPDGRAGRDVLLQRAIGWTATIGLFLGLAIWPEIVGRLG